MVILQESKYTFNMWYLFKHIFQPIQHTRSDNILSQHNSTLQPLCKNKRRLKNTSEETRCSNQNHPFCESTKSSNSFYIAYDDNNDDVINIKSWRNATVCSPTMKYRTETKHHHYHRFTSFFPFQEWFDEILSFHKSLSKACLSSKPSISKSSSTHFFHVFFGLPTGLCPSRFILHTLSLKLSFGFLNIWPNLWFLSLVSSRGIPLISINWLPRCPLNFMPTSRLSIHMS